MGQFIFVFLSIFKIVCYFNIFNKCNEKGWKAIIPFLNTFVRTKLFYKKSSFIIYMLFVVVCAYSLVMLAICGLELLNYSNGEIYDMSWVNDVPESLTNSTTMFFGLLLICGFVFFVYDTVLNYYMAKSFNKGNLFFIGLVFFNAVFLAILAFFNENTYIGNLQGNKTNQVNQNY